MNVILSLMVIQVFGGFCDSLVGRIKDERDNSDTYKDNLVLDAYNEIFFMFKIEKPDDFTVDVLNDVVEKFFDKLTCRRNLDLTATSSTGCRHTVCLNTSSLLRAAGYLQGAIDKNVFQKSSTIMLNYALEKDKFCHTEVNVDDNLQYFRNHVFELLKGESNHTELHMGRLQRRLEELDDFFDEKHNHTHDNHDNENKHHGKENDDQDDISDEDDHNERVEKIQIIKEKCISAGTLYDQMGIDIDDVLHDDDVDKLSSLIVYHVLLGSRLTSTCRTLPRKQFFTRNIFQYLQTKDNMMHTTDFMTMLKILEIGQETAESSVKSDIHDHVHKKRHVHTSRPSVENDSIWNNRCYTGEQLLAIFNVATKSVITEQKFQDICPSLIQQKISGSCMKKQNSSKTNKHQPTDAERYGYGTVGKFLCCACSLGGALIIPCAGKNLYRVLMATFVGLAVGTLSGDALIHLLPEVFGAHVHEDEQHDHVNGGEIVVEPCVWSGLAVCGGIWIFYMFESVMLIARKWRNTQIEFEADQQTDITLPTRSSKNQNGNGSTVTLPMSDRTSSLDHSRGDLSTMDVNHGRYPPVVYMVLFGDGLHNFVDGLAIGAAFTQNILMGVSVSITIICHEFPHELGDLAILLRNGMSFKKALLFNFLSSLTAFIGLYIALAISTETEVRNWIFAVTAGLFLYISLADMIPEMVHKTTDKPILEFVCNNIGMFLGVTIMIIIAVFEGKLEL